MHVATFVHFQMVNCIAADNKDELFAETSCGHCTIRCATVRDATTGAIRSEFVLQTRRRVMMTVEHLLWCLYSEELRNLYASPDIIRLIKSWRVTREGHVTLMRM
jgi:hypothetical protein